MEENVERERVMKKKKNIEFGGKGERPWKRIYEGQMKERCKKSRVWKERYEKGK